MADPKHTNASVLAEIQTAFIDATSRSTKFIISTGIILLILVVVVGQELREYRAKQGALVRQITEVAKDNRYLLGQLEDKCGEFIRKSKDLKQGADEPYLDQESPVRAAAVHDELLERRTKDDELFLQSLRPGSARSESEIRSFLRRMERRAATNAVSPINEFDVIRTRISEGCESKSPEEVAANHTRWMVPRTVRNSHNGRSPESLTAAAHLLGESIDQLKIELDQIKKEETAKLSKADDKDKPSISAQYQTSSREELVNLLVDHKQLFERSLARQNELASVVKESHDLNDKKNSIPTPFGNFQIAPRLALLGLAYATLLTYFSFYAAVRRMRRLANQYNGAADGGPYLTIPAPFWSPDPADRNERNPPKASQYFPSIGLSVLLHITWLLVSGWLIFEVVYRWDAIKALNFDYRPFWIYLLIAGFVCAVIAATWLFFPSSSKAELLERAGRGSSLFQPSRRQMIRLVGIGVVGILGVGVLNYLRSSKAKSIQRLRVGDFTKTARDGRWVQNKKTKIVHFDPGDEVGSEFCCYAHVPSEANRISPPIDDAKGIHVGCEARIYETLAAIATSEMLNGRGLAKKRPELTAEARQHGELAVQYLNKAIDQRPFSMHLYDFARRVYAGLERFDEITSLLEKGRSRVKAEIDTLGYDANKKRRTQRITFLRRTDHEFAARIKTTEERRQRAIEWQKKQQTHQPDAKQAEKRRED